MITSMHIENFKCFKDFDIELGPNLNVLIGPNDTGKTALLQAIRVVACLEMGAELKSGHIFDRVGIGVGVESRYSKAEGELAIRIRHRPRNLASEASQIAKTSFGCQSWTLFGEKGFPKSDFGEIAFYQFDPRALRKPTELSAGMDSDGKGLPGFIARLALERDGTMDSLEADFKRRFPFYAAIVTKPIPGDKGDMSHLKFRTTQGAVIPCQSVSDGVMLSLAYMAVCHAKQSPEVLLIEEPENGVHHASLKEIIETLKHLSDDKGVQVILTTHSPYLLDHVEADQVHVFTKDPDEGSVTARKLSDFEGADEISEMFSTGEKWSLLAEKYGI